MVRRVVANASNASLAAAHCIPANPERHIHIGYSVALAVVLWLLGTVALVATRVIIR